MMDPIDLFGLISGCILLLLILIAGRYGNRTIDQVFDRLEERANREMKKKESPNAD